MGKIYIPKTCRVGFQNRDGTFAGKLAYVIYYDSVGKLRKEKSWNTWCDSKIKAYDFENVPTLGFVLNKGHTRHPWSSFGQRRTVIRIYDPRGIEFEVTPENLVGLLMHTDCARREVQGDLVYAWCGTELMLLPCSSEEYAAAVNYTKLQGVSLGVADLKEGFTYVTKNEESLVYLGRHMWYETHSPYGKDGKRVGTKQHIFCDLDGKAFKPVKSVSSTIAKQVSDDCHDRYAKWVDTYLKSTEASRIVGWKRRSIPDEDWDRVQKADDFYGMGFSAYTDITGPVTSAAINKRRPWVRFNSFGIASGDKTAVLCYRPSIIVLEDGSEKYVQHDLGDQIVRDRSAFFYLYAIYENGTEQKWG
jgi:hypothetical protein